MELLERFLKYIKIPTTSDSKSQMTPSTTVQRNLAKVLVEELKDLHLDDVYYDEEHCYIYAVLKGNDKYPKIGFISHMDTAEDEKGENIKPNIIYNYDGNPIKLKNNVTLTKEEFGDLKQQIGKTLITTDGTTLLGADDKAGIAEIMNMLEYFSNNNEEHGDIYVAFTPDEEIGMSTEYFDFSKFEADYAYTVDGYDAGEITYETFNAATANIEINGINAHCGTAKNKMVNSILLANTINELLPDETPRNTEGYEGFYHLKHIKGEVSKTTMQYLIRDFDSENFKKRKKKIEVIVEELNAKYNNCIHLEITDTYYNMIHVIKDNFHLIENAYQAITKLNIPVITEPIRGGTDGASLSFMGLPCPNLGTGGHNYHSVYEHISLEDMQDASNILIGIIKEYAKDKKQLRKK